MKTKKKKLFAVHVETVMVVAADTADLATGVAFDFLDPNHGDWSFEARGEIRSEKDLPAEWDAYSIPFTDPYQNDLRTPIKDYLGAVAPRAKKKGRRT